MLLRVCQASASLFDETAQKLSERKVTQIPAQIGENAIEDSHDIHKDRVDGGEASEPVTWTQVLKDPLAN